MYMFFFFCFFFEFKLCYCWYSGQSFSVQPEFRFFFREVDGQWIEEEKLEAHSDWVRDVAWALNVGLPVSTFACVPR